MSEFIISVPSEMTVWFDLKVRDSATVKVPHSTSNQVGKNKEISFTVVREAGNRIRIVPYVGKDLK